MIKTRPVNDKYHKLQSYYHDFAHSLEDYVVSHIDWIEKAIPFLKAELWRVSDCLALPAPTGLGEDLDKEIDEKLEEDHAILTELLKEVGALEE